MLLEKGVLKCSETLQWFFLIDSCEELVKTTSRTVQYIFIMSGTLFHRLNEIGTAIKLYILIFDFNRCFKV